MTAYYKTGTTAGADPVKASLDAITAMCNSGTLKIYSDVSDSSHVDPDVGFTGTLLATFTFNATAFTDAAATGTFPNKSITATAAFAANTVSAAASATAGSFGLFNSGGTLIATGSVGTSGADINFNSVAFSSGANITLSSFTLVMPE
jgi:hypothetical protein